MSNPPRSQRWLDWAREIQSLAQTGLAFTTAHYDVQRYTRLGEIAAEIVAEHTGLDDGLLKHAFFHQPGYATPKIDVRGAVIRHGKILLVQERVDGRWCMPGGWADVDEAPAEMVAREVVEESGLVVKPTKVVGVFDANRAGIPREFFHAYKLVFLCEYLKGEPGASDETSAAEFFDFNNLPPLSSPRTEERHLVEVQAHLRDPQRATVFD